jgi:acetoin utilization deacetylase AcuC-like enzyme
MILYEDTIDLSLFDYGIEIPIYDTRASKTFELLNSHPVLGKRMTDIHANRIDEILTREDLLRVHSEDYVGRLFSDGLEKEIIKTYELIDTEGHYNRYDPAKATRPLTEIFDFIMHKTAGTVQCCRMALEKGFCFYFSGGAHHARQDTGNGFCMLNDVVIATRKLQAEKRIERVWVIDVDAHKGDGTASLTKGDDSLRTLSIHMARGWPLDGEQFDRNGNLNPSFIISDIDVPIEPGEDHLYVEKLGQALRALDMDVKPDLAIVVCGSDPYEDDELPSTAGLKLSLEQLLQRDQLVYTFLKERDIPKAYVMAGGYGKNSWRVYTQFLQWALPDHLGITG